MSFLMPLGSIWRPWSDYGRILTNLGVLGPQLAVSCGVLGGSLGGSSWKLRQQLTSKAWDSPDPCLEGSLLAKYGNLGK